MAAPRVGPAVALLLLVGLAIASVAYPLASDWPNASLGSGAIERDLPRAAAIAIFAATYLVLAIGRLPGSRLDRAGAALLGASLMVAIGALTTEEAYRAIDLDTITLLLGMMIVVANLRLSGFFRLVNAWVATHAGRPLVLLVGVVVERGRPVGLPGERRDLPRPGPARPRARHAGCGAIRVPYLLAVAMASNVGSDGDDHRQSAEHDDRELVANSLHHLSGAPRPGGRARARWSPR